MLTIMSEKSNDLNLGPVKKTMGHITDARQAYGLLQKRLDQKLKGALDSPTLMKILSIVFKPGIFPTPSLPSIPFQSASKCLKTN